MPKKNPTNPFKPTAGAEPPVLVGRQQVIDDFIDGLDEGVGAPSRLMRISGPRGSGKTVIMAELSAIAQKRGWATVRESARSNLVEHIVSKLASKLPSTTASADADLGFIKLHAGINDGNNVTADLESVLSSACGKLGKKGLLITIDEVQNASKSDMTDIASAVQFLIQDKKDIAFVFAGITTGVLDIINDEGLTFLRRAKAEELEPLRSEDVMTALREPFEDTGMEIGSDELAEAAEATGGYAFLVQLVGYYVWRECRRHLEESTTVTSSDVKEGIKIAKEEHARMVMVPILSRLTERPMRYLVAMAEDSGPTATNKISERMGKTTSSISSARASLISKQIIEPAGRGFVDFSIPHMREYVRENADELLSKFD